MSDFKPSTAVATLTLEQLNTFYAIIEGMSDEQLFAIAVLLLVQLREQHGIEVHASWDEEP